MLRGSLPGEHFVLRSDSVPAMTRPPLWIIGFWIIGSMIAGRLFFYMLVGAVTWHLYETVPGFTCGECPSTFAPRAGCLPNDHDE